MSPEFIHLRLHTDYSLIDGVVRLKALLAQLKTLNMPAVAVTDEMNLFALVKFQKAAMSAGIKPIFGADVWIAGADKASPHKATLLMQDLTGYRHLTELISLAYLQGQSTRRPLIEVSWIEQRHQGLIMMSGALQGEIGQAIVEHHPELAERAAKYWSELFGDRFYLEVQRVGRENEETLLDASIALAQKYQIGIVATNDVRFLSSDEFGAHEVRTCISSGSTLDDENRKKIYTEQQYLRPMQDMQELFKDLPQALTNSVEIAKRCNLEVPLGTYHLPNFEVPEGLTLETFFRKLSNDGLVKRLEKIDLEKIQEGVESSTREDYFDRLMEELDIIIQMGFPGYFLIVMDFIQWAKQNGVPVGPGRGSGAGSLVAYALDITDIDPIAYGLLFERFLNPERVSMPDFDVDFCMEGRDRVIEYVAQKYGRNAVSQIITYGTMAAKAVVRDVGRVLGKPYGFVDRIAKMVPFELGMTLSKALEQEEQFKTAYDEDDEIRDLLDMALQLEGLTRNVGKHAGGVVIAPGDLTAHAPLYCDEEGQNLVTQYDKDDVEQAGLVKFDFLGLRTLTIVNWAVLAINEQRVIQNESLLDITEIDLCDSTTFDLLKDANTTAVFQLESRGMKDLIKRLLPSSFEDIIALVALFRPGPLQSGMVDDFINRKHGRAQVDYPHPDLEPILENTYGVILYQEQVMQIAQVLAGYTLGGADMLRRAMGKKKAEEMAKQRKIFTEGCLERKIEETTATYIFDLMEKFAGYGFNKSHSAAYALVSYQTAWLKNHFPAYFMAAVLSSDMDNTDKVVNLVHECKRMNIELVAPSINRSQYKFSVGEGNQIIYGLGAIKGLGEGPVASIVLGRQAEAGSYRGLLDFCQRVDLKKMNKRAMEALIKSGSLDDFAVDRATLLENLAEATRAAQQIEARANSGMIDLLADLDMPEEIDFPLKAVPPWSEKERLNYEKETLGLFLTGHPLNEFKSELPYWRSATIEHIRPTDKGKTETIVGLVVAVRSMRNKRGERMAFVTIDDRSGRIDVSFFSDKYLNYIDLIKKDEILIVTGDVSLDQFSGLYKMVVHKVSSPDELREASIKKIHLTLDVQKHSEDTVERIQKILNDFKSGSCQLEAKVNTPDLSGLYQFNEAWRVYPRADLIKALRDELGEAQVTLEYAHS